MPAGRRRERREDAGVAGHERELVVRVERLRRVLARPRLGARVAEDVHVVRRAVVHPAEVQDGPLVDLDRDLPPPGGARREPERAGPASPSRASGGSRRSARSGSAGRFSGTAPAGPVDTAVATSTLDATSPANTPRAPSHRALPITRGETRQCSQQNPYRSRGGFGATGSVTRWTPLVVGFDLDMTLIDSRPGVHATICALVAETGVLIDPDVVVARLGPPLEQELAALGAGRPDRSRSRTGTASCTARSASPGRRRSRARPTRSTRSGPPAAARSSSPRSSSPTRGSAWPQTNLVGRRRRRLAPRPAEGRDARRARCGGLRRRHTAGHGCRRASRVRSPSGCRAGRSPPTQLERRGRRRRPRLAPRVPRLVSGRLRVARSNAETPRNESGYARRRRRDRSSPATRITTATTPMTTPDDDQRDATRRGVARARVHHHGLAGREPGTRPATPSAGPR